MCGYAAQVTTISFLIQKKVNNWEDMKGDAFRSRYESYLTDPKLEPRKTKWQIEVAIKPADQQSA